MWVCVASALPVNVSAGIEAAVPVKAGTELVPTGVNAAVPFVGTPAGHATVPAGVNAAVPFVPVAVRVWVWVASADPVKVSAGTVNELPGETPPMVENAPALVPALLPVTVATLAVPLVPAGVPALTAEVVAELPVKVCAGTVPLAPVKAGTPAGHAITSAGTVPEFPVKVDAATVPCGV